MFSGKSIFIFVFCLANLAVFSQNLKSLDSLESVLATTNDPSDKLKVLLALSYEYIDSDITKSLEYAEQAHTLAESNNDKRGLLNISLRLARIYYYKSDLTKAMEFAVQAKSLAEGLNLNEELAYSLDAIGGIYYDIGNQTQSSENFFTSLKIYEKLQDKEGLGATYCRIGTLYFDQKDYDKAEDYFLRSIELAREINSNEGIASNLNNLAKVYFEKKEYEKALEIYEEALKINLEEGSTFMVASNYLNIADVFLDLKKYPEAILNIQLASDIYEKIGNKLRLTKCQVLLSRIYFKTGELNKAEDLALKTLKIGESEGYNEIIVSAAGILNKLHLSQGDSTTAFRYYMIENQYKDSLFLDEKQKTLTKLELQYQFDKNEQSLKIARQRKNVVIFIISGCLFFSLIIMFLILKQLRLKAKKMQLEKASHDQELAFKNKEMVINVMSLMKKNEMLADLSEKLITIEKETTSSESKDAIKKVAHELQKSQEEEIWKEFSVRFKEVHGEFYNKLLHRFPTLSPNELKLCAFLRLNMSSKDIAELTGQRVSSLETARYRLRQKLGIANSDINLITFLSSL